MNKAANQSTFVTVVAWIFIVLSGFGTMISILQNIMVQTVFNSPEMGQAMQATPPGAPPFAAFIFSHFQLFILALFVATAGTLVSSIGLLKRKNWARLIFVGLMALGIIWNLGGLIVQFSMFSSMQQQFAAAPGAPDMQPFFIAMAVVTVLIALGFSGLFGWIAKRLLSPNIAAEFGR